MTLNEYQKKAMRTCMDESKNLNYMALGLASEAGEVANQDVDSPDEGKKAAQDWLNKLVAEVSMQSTCSENVSKNGEDLKVSDSTGLKTNCTEKSDSSTPQFTAEEIDGIRKLAQFSGFMIANSIIAKCDAMLKGAEE